MANKPEHEAMHLAGGIADNICNKIWEAPHGFSELHGFTTEDPTLTGRQEDGDDGLPIVLIRKEDGQRFSIEVEIFVHVLGPLEKDPNYVDPNKPKTEDVPLPDPDQGALDI